jgi:hypothetical protein
MIIVLACKNSSHQNYIPQDSMKVIIVDLMTADEWNNILMSKDTSLRRAKLNEQFYQSVFDKHQVTKEQFYNSYKFYDTRPDKMKALIDSAFTYIEKLKQQKVLTKKK